MMEAGVLHYVGRELVEGGLLQNDAWVAEAVWRSDAMFATKGLKTAAGILASLHPRAIDFIEQCPALVVAAIRLTPTNGARHPMSVKRIRMRMASHFYQIFRTNPRLRDVIASLGLVNQHRALAGWGLREDHWEAMVALSSVKASTLAQIMPTQKMAQANWLSRLTEWRHAVLRAANDSGLHFEWAAIALARCPNTAHNFGWPSDVADFVVRSGIALNDRWTWERAGKEASEWHTALQRMEEDKKHLARFGLDWTEPCDYGELPVELSIDKVCFIALRSGADLAAEGSAMHHCVRSYIDDVMVGHCRIYGLRHDDRRLATMELLQSPAGRWTINQLKGPYNATPAHYVHHAADAFLKRINGAAA